MWSRKSALASVPPTQLWPSVNSAAMEPEQARIFTARQKAMELYFADEKIKNIERLTGVSFYQLPRMAKRCLQVAR